MFGNNQRIVLGFVSFILGCIFIYINKGVEGALLIIGSLLMIYAYFRYGTVHRAFQSLKRNNFNKAKEELAHISKPDMLSKSQKGFYFLSMGLISLRENELDAAENYFKKTFDFRLRTANNISLLNLSLAELYLKKEQYQEASTYLENSKKTPHKSSIDRYIDDLEKILNDINS